MGGRETETTHACASLAPRACSRRYSRGSAPSRQTDTRADSHALAIWLTSQTYCFVIMHVCVLFGGLFLASPLPLSPDCAPPRTRPVRARVPGLAPPELLFKRASPLTRCLNTCSSARSPAPPPAPRSISKYSLRPEPRPASPVLRESAADPLGAAPARLDELWM